MVRRRDEIGNVRGKMRVGEIAFAGAEPGEIEAEHGDAARRERLGNTPSCQAVLAAGEAMRKQRIGDRLLGRTFEPGGEQLAGGIGKIEAFGSHGSRRAAPRIGACSLTRRDQTPGNEEGRAFGPPFIVRCRTRNFVVQALPTGSATNLVCSPDFTRIRIVCLPWP
jgi:hypothetical protein